jgi:putrescine transport system substrate-binding protein
MKLAAAAVALSLLAAIGAASAQEAKEVNVYNWSDYIDPATLKQFEAETGIKVTYDVYDSNEILDAKLRAGKSGYDLVGPTASPFLAQQIPAGLYQPIDPAKLSNLKNLDTEILTRLQRYDAGNKYALPWMWGTTGIGYNTKRIERAMKNAPVDSLRMVFDPNVVQNFKSCGVVILDSPTDVMPAVLTYLGLEADSARREDLDKAVEHMRKIRPHIRRFHSSEYINDLANGDICLAFGFSGDILQAANRAGEAKKGVEIAFGMPKEGAQLWFDVLAIPADAPHPGNAHIFLDFMMRPDIAAKNATFVGYASPNAAGFKLLDKAVREDTSIYPDEQARRRLYTITPKPRDYEEARTRAWTRIKSGR